MRLGGGCAGRGPGESWWKQVAAYMIKVHCIHVQKLQKKKKVKKVGGSGEMSRRGNHWSHKHKSQVLFL